MVDVSGAMTYFIHGRGARFYLHTIVFKLFCVLTFQILDGNWIGIQWCNYNDFKYFSHTLQSAIYRKYKRINLLMCSTLLCLGGRSHGAYSSRVVCLSVCHYASVGGATRHTAGPAEANFHWTGSSLIFIFIAYNSAPLQFVRCFGRVWRESLSTKQVYTDS